MTDQNTGLLDRIRNDWINSVGGMNILAGDPDTRERLCDCMSGVASRIEETMRNMVAERERVRNQHPYDFGNLLNFLLEIVAEIQDASGDMVPVSRFEIMQNAGYWPDYRFNDWASEYTGVKRKTWQQWCHATRTLFDSAEGKELLDSQDLNPEEWKENVPMGKAVRALCKIGAGTMEEHHIDALVDQTVSEAQLNHKLRTTKAQDEVEKVEQQARDEEFVAKGKQKEWVEYEPSKQRLMVKRFDENGKYSENVIFRVPDPATAFVGLVQQVAIAAAKACESQYGAPGLFDVVEARAQEKAEVESG